MGLISNGEPAPQFCLPDSGHSEICLTALKGKWVVLYFYPKDNTSGCTLEARSFSDNIDLFKSANAVVIGISPDSCESHGKFIEKNSLDLVLLSDESHEILEKYGVWQKKKMYGREFMGVVRTTYIISPDGKVAEVFPKVKVKGHSDAVMDRLKALSGD